jgi:hypothetical protein
MKEFEGTQGAWRLDSFGNELVIVRESDKQHILTMRTGSLPKEKKANAQLIATAPELLEALQKAICYVPIDEEDFDSIARVINKALGK